MIKNRSVGLLLVGLVLIVLSLLILEIHGLPTSIDSNYGEATIHFSTNRSWRLLADTCFVVNWNLDHINAAYLNGKGESGFGEETLCAASPAHLTVDFPDGTSQTYVLPINTFFATLPGWISLFSITILLYSLLYFLNWIPAPGMILQHVGQSLLEINQAIRAFFSHKNLNHLLLLLAILIGGTLLRLIYLDGPMRYDESRSFNDYVQVENIFDSLSRYERPNNHLLNTLLMYLSMKSFGRNDEWVLRLPELLAGLATILLTYLVARQEFNKQIALLSASLVAVSSAMITYSVMARGYMLQIAFFMGLVLAVQRLVKAKNLAAWLGFIVATALGFYAVPIMLYGFLAMALVLLVVILRRDRTRLLEWMLGVAWASWFTLLLYMPVLARFGLGAISSNSYTISQSLEDFLQTLPRSVLVTLSFWLEGTPPFLWLVFLLALLLGVLNPVLKFSKTGESQKGQILSMFPLLLLFILLILIIQRPALYAAPHMFLFLLPLLAILISTGLAYLFAKIKFSGIVAGIGVLILAGFIIFSQAPHLSYEGGIYHDAEDVAIYLSQEENLNYRLAFSPNYDQPLLYYFQHYDLSAELISRDYQTVDTIYFIVRDSFDASVESVVNELVGQTVAEFTQPQLAASFSFSDLYRMDRR
jgi:hypothetical protein